jgi:nicotinamidase-related amidase
MTPEKFEDHCWQDVIDRETLDIYAKNIREVRVGGNPALLAIDLYNKVYEGGDRPIREIFREFPSTCGENAWKAIEPTRRLFAASRKAGIPIIYTTGAAEGGEKLRNPARVWRNPATNLDPYGIKSDFEPEPGDRVIYKERASAFCGTPLQMYLQQKASTA